MIAVKEAESLFADAKLDVLRGTLSHGAKKIIITTHHKPDADALGSSLGLAGYLQKLDHNVRVITPTDFPSFLDWMPGRSYVLQFDQNDKTKAEAAKLVAEADVIFCLDFNTLERINDLGKLVGQSTARKVMIDHHMQPADFADLIFSDIHAAATAELVYLLIDALGQRELIDKGVAECLYAGIMTDTGSFRHGSTTARIHRVIADLIELGADNSRVHTLIYDNSSLNRLQFLGYCLSEKLVYLPEFKTAYFAITKEELQEELLQIWTEHRCTVLMITHDIDEALFLADRIVMMTNGPSAKIGEILDIPFARPRVRSRVTEDPRYYELRNYALDFLYNRFAHSEDPLESEIEPEKSSFGGKIASVVGAVAIAALLGFGFFQSQSNKPAQNPTPAVEGVKN